MIIQRTPPRHPRSGPSCTLVIIVAVVFALGIYVVGNAEEVREVIVPTPTPAPTRSAVEYATSAALYERDGEYASAIEAYEQAIAMDTGNVNYFMSLVDLLIRAGRAEEALERAQQAKVLAPSDSQVWAAVSSAHLANGNRLWETGDQVGAKLQFQEAINAAEQATSIEGSNAEAYAYMAQALVQMGYERYNEAAEVASLAVELDPTSATTRRAMANVFEMGGNYDRAIEEYLLALDANPDLIDMRIDLAYLYFFNARQQQGILTLQDVLEIDPSNAAAYDGLSYFYFVLGEYPDSEENAFQAVQLDPDMNRAHAHLGAARFKQSKYDTAIEELEIAVGNYDDITTSNATYFNMLGLAYYYTDRCPEALPLFRRVLATAPDETAVLNAEEGMELCRQWQLDNNS
ncbi:MAG: tetratricopeptide repeat protein [Candidatus Promineifilaceae bacterium]|nr:tetratricopeptide repeat protein [Candidatus Promineifilaceae bacterium]